MVSIPRCNFEELVLEEYWEFYNNFWCVEKVCSSDFVFCNFGLSILPVVYSIIANKTRKSCLLVCYRYHYLWCVAIALEYQNHEQPNRNKTKSAQKRTAKKQLIFIKNHWCQSYLTIPIFNTIIKNVYSHVWFIQFWMVWTTFGASFSKDIKYFWLVLFLDEYLFFLFGRVWFWYCNTIATYQK